MKFIWKIAALIIISLGLSGCLFDGGVAWEDEEYHVGWIDAEDNTLYCTISNGGLMKVKPRIISVGSNDLFVVAKRRSEGGPVQYYYIQNGFLMNRMKRTPLPSCPYHISSKNYLSLLQTASPNPNPKDNRQKNH